MIGSGKKKKEEKIPKELLKRIRKIEIKSRVLVTEAMSGGYNSIFRGYGMEFQEVREYFPGDDYRRIDWNVTSRHTKPYVKVFKEERQLNVMLLVDISGSLEYGSTESTKHEKLTETAAVISMTALSNQDKIGAVFFTDKVEKKIVPSKNRNTILRLLREVIFLKPTGKGTNINAALDYAHETMHRRGIIFILSDFYAPVDSKRLFIASKKHDIIPIVFSDTFEQVPVNVGLVDMIDNETGEMRLVDTNSVFYKRSIVERETKREKLFADFRKLGLDPLIISTTDDIERVILRYFDRRRKKLHL